MKALTAIKITIGILLAVMIVSYSWWAPLIGIPAKLPDSDFLRQWFLKLGFWGPVAVIGLMILAILVSPIPSAPIALAAGAIYGHLWGTVYVAFGAEAGAIAAFSIARFLGYEAMHKRFGKQLGNSLAGSQNALTLVVFISRLMPFISFDIISYAAGITPLKLWRFALATAAGILPASFLLAHFGSELVVEENSRVLLAVVLLGAVTAIPVVIKLISGLRQGN